MVSPNITHDEKKHTPTLNYRKQIYCEKKNMRKPKRI